MPEKIELDKTLLIEVLYGICLADHLGDVMDEVEKLSKLVGINEISSQEDLLNKMNSMDLIPDRL